LACARFSGSSFKFCPKDALLSFELLFDLGVDLACIEGKQEKGDSTAS
jgi:hypothetical protein